MGTVSFMRNENGKLWPLDGYESLKILNKGQIYAISHSTKACYFEIAFLSRVYLLTSVSQNIAKFFSHYKQVN
ncbi:hypothetical protein [Paraglaciecola sp.]|uniref:hypothetical protein n=1 Tax=Paraglaciecola sp. TaxID=1920173 RepID=UPI003EF97609